MKRFLIGSAAAPAVLLIVVSILHIDVSALRDFERDAVMLHAPTNEVDRYFDPSGHSMWLPSDLFVWDSVRALDLPLWDRLQGGGFSTLNAIHSGVFHPIRWLTALVPRRSAPTALIVLTLWLAFAGMFVLMRAEHSATASAVAAIAFTFSSVLISMVHFSGAILPLAHIPWIVFFARRPGRLSTVGLVLSIALLFLSGHPLLEACAAMTAGAVVVADGVAARSSRNLRRFVFASIAGVFIAAPAWLPAILSRSELWTYKTRTAQGASYFVYSFRDWLTALRAMVLDTFDVHGCCIDLGGFYLYVGIAAIALAVVGATRLRAMAVLLAIAFLACVPGPWMSPLQRLVPISFFKPWYLIGAFAFFVAMLAGSGFDSLWRGSRVRRIVAAGLALIVCVTYIARAMEVLRPRIAPEQTATDVIRFLRNDREPFRVFSLWGQTHMPNASRMTRIEDLRLAGPILTLRYHLFWQLIDRDILSRAYPTTRITDVLDSPLVGGFNVKYFIQSRLAPVGSFRVDRDERSRDAALSPRLNDLPVVGRTNWVEVRRNTRGFAPRAHFAESVQRAASLGEALTMLSRDPRATVAETDDDVRGGTGRVAVSYSGDRAVRLDVNGTTGGLVVLHDSFAEGWEATVDGKDAAIVPVNVLSRGVMVGPGTHRIEMTYLPASFTASVAFAAVTLLAVFFAYNRSKA